MQKLRSKLMFRSQWIRLFPVLGMILWLASAPVPAMMIKLPLLKLSREADAVLQGRVEDIRCEWNLNQDLIFTFVTIKVLDIWKGDVPFPSVVIRIPGGRIGDLQLKVSDAAAFQPGEDILVFLKDLGEKERLLLPRTGPLSLYSCFTVFGGAQGKYSIDGNRIARKQGYTLYQKDGQEDRSVPLSVLKKRVKTFLNRKIR